MTNFFTRTCLAASSLLLAAFSVAAQGGGGPGGGATPDSLGIYTFAGAAGTELIWPVDRSFGNSTFSDMRRGPGVTPSQGAGAFSSAGWTQATVADTAQYYAFRITAASGATLNLDTLGLSERRSATGIQQWEVRSSLDGFATPLYNASVPDSVTYRKWRIALGSSFDAVSSVEFRIYGYASEATAGTWRIDNVYLMGTEGTGGGPTLPPLRTIASVTQNDASGVPTSLNQQVRLRGVISSPNTRTSGYLLTLIDRTGGITLFRSTNFTNSITSLNVGDSVEVVGTITQFNGLTELVADSALSSLANQPVPTPAVVTTLDESTESELVQINGPLTLVDAAQWTNTGSGFNVDVTDGTNTYQMRIVRGTDIYGTNAPTQPFRLVGIGGQFDNASPYFEGYQIAPRSLADIQAASNPVPEVAFGQPSLTVSEGVGMATIPVTITNPSTTAATTVWVRFADVPGTATLGTDYSFAPQQLTFPAGSSASQNVTVMVIENTVVEGDETVNLQLDSVSTGATIGANAAFVLTITDNDTLAPASVHFISNTATETEGDTAEVTVIFDLPAATTQPLTVDVMSMDVTTTAGSDYTPVNTTLTLAPQAAAGSYNVVVRVPLTDDAIVEPTEMLHLMLQNASTGLQITTPDTWMLNVLDNDTAAVQPGLVSFAAAGDTVAENPSRRIDLPVTVSLPSDITASVMFHVKSTNSGTAQPGLDYLPVDTMIVVSPRVAGTYAFTASLQLLDDTAVEGNETIQVQVDTMGTGLFVGLPSLYTITITDDDVPPVSPVVAFDTVGRVVPESAGTIQVPVTITNPSATTATTVVVRLANNAGTATAGTDYTFARQVLTFPAGSSAPQLVSLTIIDDVLDENLETLRLRLDSVSTGASIDSSAFRFLLGIVDNDTTTGPTPPLSTIAAISGVDAQGVATSLNQQVRVRGVVLSQNLRTSGYQSAVQDRTGGIGLFAPAANTGPFPAYADSVEVVGRITQFRGLTQITIDSFRVLLPSQPLPSAHVVTTLDETTESELLQIAGPLTLVNTAQWTNAASGFTVDVTDGTRTYPVRIPAGSALVTSAPPAQPFRVWGIGSQFATSTTAPFLDGYQLIVRFITDFGLLTATSADASTPVLALFPNPATDRLTVVAPQATTATVIDALGRVVRSVALTSGTVTFEVRDLQAGVYTVRAGAQVQRFVKE